MVGSINAPEPGFRPGVRWGLGSPEHGRQRTHQVFVPARAGLWHAPGVWHALAGSGVLGGLACAGGLVRAGGLWRVLGALARVGGVRLSLAIDAVSLVLGVVLRFACCPGLPVCGAARGGERHVLLRSYVVGVHWVRAYACVALGEWRTDAASEEVYVGAGGGIASVA